MRAGRPSRTAEQNAAFRAAESARPPGVRLLNDPYAARLLPPGLRILAWISSVPMVGGGLNWFVDTRWPGARSSIIARTRLIDEWLCAAMRVGLEQVVLLGAGFDSRAWRLPAVAHARVFEVDHPSTSAEKRRRLANLGTDRAHVRFVPVDFDRQMPADAHPALHRDCRPRERCCRHRLRPRRPGPRRPCLGQAEDACRRRPPRVDVPLD